MLHITLMWISVEIVVRLLVYVNVHIVICMPKSQGFVLDDDSIGVYDLKRFSLISGVFIDLRYAAFLSRRYCTHRDVFSSFEYCRYNFYG